MKNELVQPSPVVEILLPGPRQEATSSRSRVGALLSHTGSIPPETSSGHTCHLSRLSDNDLGSGLSLSPPPSGFLEGWILSRKVQLLQPPHSAPWPGLVLLAPSFSW